MRYLVLLAAVALAVLFSLPAAAQPTVVQNDSVVDFGQAAIQAGFVSGEVASAWLTSPCEGDITSVRIVWLALLGGGSSTLGEWVRIFDDGTFPTPGDVLVDLAGPLMVEGFENEFTLPIPVPVSPGQNFVVGFRFLDAPSAFGPSVVTDTDGCQAGKNGILAIPPNAWFSSCALGVTGDFAIRAVVTCDQQIPIFADGFESGDTSAWDVTVP